VSTALGHLPDARITRLLVERAAEVAGRALSLQGTLIPCATAYISAAFSFLTLAQRTAPKTARPRVLALFPDLEQALRSAQRDPRDQATRVVTDAVGILARAARSLR
jgi:hypothetical protein